MRILTLNRNDIAAWDDTTPFVLPGDLEFDVRRPMSLNGEYVVTAKQGDRKWQTKTVLYVKVPREFLRAGELEITVALYLKGQKITEYVADPLMMVQEAGELTAMPVISSLRAEVQELTDKLASVEEELETYKQAAESQIAALSGQTEEAQKELTRRMDLIEGGYDPLKV